MSCLDCQHKSLIRGNMVLEGRTSQDYRVWQPDAKQSRLAGFDTAGAAPFHLALATTSQRLCGRQELPLQSTDVPAFRKIRFVSCIDRCEVIRSEPTDSMAYHSHARPARVTTATERSTNKADDPLEQLRDAAEAREELVKTRLKLRSLLL